MKPSITGYSICTLLLAGQVSSFSQDKPNILIIHTDEHNFRTLGCYRQFLPEEQAYPWGKGNQVETPHIDYLAQRGMLFRNCYATTPVSSPSRASFLTGLYPQNAGMYINDMELRKEAFTFADILRSNGYSTGYMGKLHVNGKDRPGWNPERDFGFTDNRYMYNRGHWKIITEGPEGTQFEREAAIQTADSTNFTTDFLINKTIDFVRHHIYAPFCCMVSLPDPHGPNQVRTPYDTLYSNRVFEQPITAFKDTTGLPAWSHGDNLPEDRMENMAAYFGMIKCIDDNIGKIISVLQETNLLEKTVIIFTSDHGDMCGEHGLINKGVPLEASAKIPFIISYPAGISPNSHTNQVMSVVDFTPSLLSFCGIQTTQPFDGRDMSSVWKGEQPTDNYKDIIFMRSTTPLIESDWDESATARRNLWLSVVTPTYKLTYSENKEDVPWLTDLSKDPDELVNCYFNPEYSKIVKELANELVKYGKSYNDTRIYHPHIRKELERVTGNKVL
ncbi:MAG: sulfatase-like hydrolase/transferase [Tannerellaceae bacterium]|nr:sulfatase-like hydrolase/transferase [Tannerellaceae bacterium]